MTSTSSKARPSMIASTARPASNGVATARTASTTLVTMNQVSITRCGRANARMRRTVAHENGRCSCWATIRLYSELHAAISMLMERR
jgi:hypothetical protein